MLNKKISIFLSGEIHSSWREEIVSGVNKLNLGINFYCPVTNHSNSDDCGVRILGSEDNKFWHDYKGASINSITTNIFLKRADIIVVKFGEKYRQWNAAFDAGLAVAFNKSVITLHDE